MSDYFAMGNALGSAYSDGKEEARQRNRQIDTDARAKKQYEDQQAEGLYQRTQRGQEDAAFANYTAAQNGGAAPGAGLSPESAALVQKGYAGDTGVRALQTEGGDDAREGARMGIPQAPASQRAPATPRQLNALLAPIYAQQKNAKGMADVAAQDKVLHREEITSSAGTAYDAMKPEEQAKWAGGITTGYKGDIAVTAKDPSGYTTVVLGKADDPARKSIALNDAETRQMYIASRMMAEGHGEEAQKIMLAGGEKLRAIAAEHNKFMTDSAKVNNDATHNKATDKNGAISAGAQATSAGAAVSRANSEATHVGLYVDEANRGKAALENVKVLETQFAALSPADQAGDTGRGLRHQIQIANLAPGKQIDVRDPRPGSGRSVLNTPVEQKQNQDGTYTAFAKDGGQALYNTLNGKSIPLGMTATKFEAIEKDALKNNVQVHPIETDTGIQLAFVGPDGKPYTSAREAGMSKAPPSSPEVKAPVNGIPDRAGQSAAAELYKRGRGPETEARDTARLAAADAARGVRAKAAADPELQRMMGQAASLARGGNASGAATAAAQVDALRKQRYGI